MDRRLRVLLIAEQANPEWVSVPLEGWSHSRAIAELADAHLATQVRNRGAILRAGLVEGTDFTAIDSEAAARRTARLAQILRGGKGKGWTAVTALNTLSYYYFEHLLWKRFGGEIRRKRYDLVHRLTPLSPTAPSLLARKCRRAGVPFVLGPLNGGLPWPRSFDTARRREKEWLSYVRAAHKLMPGYRATRRHADALIIGSRATWRQMPRRYHGKCVYIPENAVDPARFTTARPDEPVEPPVRIAFVGRLVPYKGADMLIEAAAPLVREGKATLDIIGDGPEGARLREMVEREGLAGGVRLDGWVEHRRLQHRLAESHVFGFPSIREFGGAAVLEAMAVGLVPVVVDYGGPGELVSPSTGFTIPLGDRASIVANLRRRLKQITDDPARLREMSRAARRSVMEQFTWPAKARQVLETYRWVLGEGEKPFFEELPANQNARGEAAAPA